jgi:hypothetical protein
MTDLADIELRRARWRRALATAGLDTVDRSDFAVRGLAARLRTPSVRLLLLPGDPEATPIAIDEELWAWVKNFSVVQLEGRNLRLGMQEIPTAHAAALVDAYGSREAWNSYVAIHRSGALDHGLGERGAWERNDREGNLVRVFSLISIVGRTWALLKFAGVLLDRTVIDGPWQLTIALNRTSGALLGNVGEGWAEPLTWENELPACTEEHLLWHIEFGELPRGDDAREVAFLVGDRVEDAWGTRHRRYVAHRGDLAGRFDVRKVHD